MNYNNYPNGYANTFNNYPYQPNYTFGNQANNMNLNNSNYNSNYNNNYNNNANNSNSINSIIWVQGETGAKSYLVAPNQSVELWDSENHTIYLKSADSNGIPTMKILDYKYRNTDKNNVVENELLESDALDRFVNIDDFNQLKKDFDELKNKFDSLNNNSKKNYSKKRGDNKLC